MAHRILQHRWKLVFVCGGIAAVIANIGTSIIVPPWARYTAASIFIMIVVGFVAIVYRNMVQQSVGVLQESGTQQPSATEQTNELPITRAQELSPMALPEIPPRPSSPPRVPLEPPEELHLESLESKKWSLLQTKQLLVLVFVGLTVWTLVPLFDLEWWMAVTYTILGLATLVAVYKTVAYIGNLVWRGIKRVHRAVRRRWSKRTDPEDEVEVLDPPPEKYYYYRRPHMTMFFNHVTMQLIVWLIVLVGGIALLHDGAQSPIWLSWLVQSWVSLINTYFIIRAYLLWSGTKYIVSDRALTIQRTEDVFFWMWRSTSTTDKGRLVGKVIAAKKWTEALFFRKRRSFILSLQGEDAKMKVRYVANYEKFFKALNAKSS